MAWPRQGQYLPKCDRLRSWLNGQDGLNTQNAQAPPRDEFSACLQQHAKRLCEARNPLLWIESADVAATRAIVRLAEVCDATVHVAQSPGAENVAAVTAACGTFGTSLSEVAAHADLIVHVGYGHLHQLPLLAPRFLRGDPDAGPVSPRQHILISGQGADAWKGALNVDWPHEPLLLDWPRELWLDHFTRVLMAARGDGSPADQSSETIDGTAAYLAEQLGASRYAVFIWDEDELADELDRLLVERLLEIAQHFSQTTRCSLLPLGNDPGRTTAKETLLWLTNVASTARYIDGRWLGSREGTGTSLDDWRRRHDWIMCLRNLPSDRTLPDLPVQLMIDAACNRPSAVLQVDSNAEAPTIVHLAGVGLDSPGHLIRVDHAFGAHMKAVAEKSEFVVTANEVLRELTGHVLLARGL